MIGGKKFAAVLVVLAVAVLVGGSALAGGDGDWMVRVRAINISPDEGGSEVLEDAEVGGNSTIEIDVTRFFTEHLALEVIAATSSQEVRLEGSSLGSVYHLPPTATFQYHFIPDGKFRPYIGAGINYTIFYDQVGPLEDFDVDDSFGFAGQIGADIPVGEIGAFNVDLKYINIETEVELDGEFVGDLEVNPWVIGFGFGHRF